MSAPIRGRGIVVRRGRTLVLDGVDVTLSPGSVTGVIGPSGAGKTTLLRVLAGLHPPDGGTVDHRAGASRPEPGAVALLAQSPRTVCNPRWSVRRIVEEPLRIAGRAVDGATIAAAALRAGLDAELLDRYPAEVSDGQLQRACLARIVVQQPRYVLADEPVAMLDPVSARAVLAVLDDLVADGAGLALVSHNEALVRRRATSLVDVQSSGATSTETWIDDPLDSV